MMSPRISIIFKTVRYLVIGLASLTVALLCSWFFSADEPLAAGVAAALARQSDVPAAENLYPALWGFDSDLSNDPQTVGQEIIAAIKLASETDLDPTPKHEQYEKIVKKYQNADAFKSIDMAHRCNSATPNCVLHYRALALKVSSEATAHAPYLSRYRALRQYPKFAETTPITMLGPMLKWYQLTQMGALVDGQIALEMIEPAARANALRDLAGEMALWRRITNDADTLLTKMISTSLLGSKLKLASELLALHPEIAMQHVEIVAEITKPLTPDTTNMTRALDGETRFSASLGRDIELGRMNAYDGTRPNGFERMLVRAGAFKPNASLNEHFKRMHVAAGATQQSAAKETDGLAVKRLADYLYNPIGTILLDIGVPQYSQYADRANDLRGYSRLVELQRQILLKKTPHEQIPLFLAESGAALFDPHTNQPVGWNAEAGEIFFAAQSKNYREQFGERVRVAIGRK